MPHTTLRASLHPRAGPRLTPPAVVAPLAAPAPPPAAPRTTTRRTTTTVRRTTCCARPTTTPSRRQHRAHTRLASASRRRGQQIWVATSARPPARPTLALTLTLALALTPSPEHLVAFAACLAVGQPSLPEPSSEPSLRRPQYASGLSTLACRSFLHTHLTLALQPVGYLDGRPPRERSGAPGHPRRFLRVTRCRLVPGACISSSDITFTVGNSSCLTYLSMPVTSHSQTSYAAPCGSSRARASPASLLHLPFHDR